MKPPRRRRAMAPARRRAWSLVRAGSIRSRRYGPLRLRFLPAPAALGLSAVTALQGPGVAMEQIVHDRTDEFIWVTRGRALARLERARVPLRAGDCLFIPAGRGHGFETRRHAVEALCLFAPAMNPAKPDARPWRPGPTVRTARAGRTRRAGRA